MPTYLGLPNEAGSADFYKFNGVKAKSMLKLASEYNMSTGDLIFELMSGSEDDIDELKEYLVMNYV